MVNGIYKTNPAEESIRLGPLAVHFLLTGSESNGSLASFELTVAAGAKLMAPAHSHDHYEESIYGLDGVLTWTVDGKPVDVGPGQMLCIPRGAVHRFDNHGSSDAKSLCVITPAAIGPEYFPRWPKSFAPLPPRGPLRTKPGWPRLCFATALRPPLPQKTSRERTPSVASIRG